MNEEKVIVCMRATTCDVPNANNVMYSGEEFNNAVRRWKESGKPLYLTIADQKCLTYDNIGIVNQEDIIGKVIEINDTDIFIKPTRTDIDYNELVDKYAAGMRYKTQLELVNDIRIAKDINIISYDLIYKDLRSFKLGIDKIPVWFEDVIKSGEITLQGEDNIYAITKDNIIIDYGTEIRLSSNVNKIYEIVVSAKGE